jgi:hypothetical protein
MQVRQFRMIPLSAMLGAYSTQIPAAFCCGDIMVIGEQNQLSRMESLILYHPMIYICSLSYSIGPRTSTAEIIGKFANYQSCVRNVNLTGQSSR